MNATKKIHFTLGKVLITPGAAVQCSASDVFTILNRHLQNDWGEISDPDWKSNDSAIRNGGRVLSGYSCNGERVWIITEADRSYTTILLPEEY